MIIKMITLNAIISITIFRKAALNYSFVDEILRCNQSNDFKKI